MKLCNSHDCAYADTVCPACNLSEQLVSEQDENIKLRKKIDDLDSQNESLQIQIDDLKRQLLEQS